MGRPSVPPEVLLKALVLQCLYSVRSERQLVERIDTGLLFRWFWGLDLARGVLDATAFTHNRLRLDKYGITAAFLEAVVRRALAAGLCGEEHFSVDGTLIQSDASINSLTPKEQPDDDAASSGPCSGGGG
ncbi:MAG: transposase, partial [Planctomycetota bacterium]